MHRYDSVKFVDTGRKGIAPVIAYYLKENGKHAILNQMSTVLIPNSMINYSK